VAIDARLSAMSRLSFTTFDAALWTLSLTAALVAVITLLQGLSPRFAHVAVGGAVEASHVAKPEGPAFDAIREQVPEGASAVVVVSDAQRAQAMTEAMASAAESIEHRRLTPAADAELRAALAEAPPGARHNPTTSP
jgi:erythromycin esterase-like protein